MYFVRHLQWCEANEKKKCAKNALINIMNAIYMSNLHYQMFNSHDAAINRTNRHTIHTHCTLRCINTVEIVYARRAHTQSINVLTLH